MNEASSRVYPPWHVHEGLPGTANRGPRPEGPAYPPRVKAARGWATRGGERPPAAETLPVTLRGGPLPLGPRTLSDYQNKAKTGRKGSCKDCARSQLNKAEVGLLRVTGASLHLHCPDCKLAPVFTAW